jgi:hypothetical protein
MNRLANWMMRLYPARWRTRYGDELNALLADTGADARVVADIFQGGIRMQFSTWSFPKLALVLGLAGMLLGTGIAFLLPNIYTSKATLMIAPAQTGALDTGKSLSLNELIQLLEAQVLSRTSLSRIISNQRLQLYGNERRDKPLEDIIEEMERNISIRSVTLPGALGMHATALDIVFSYPDRVKAQQTVNALIEAFMSLNQKRSIMPTLVPNSSSLLVLDQASFPVSPLYPNFRMVMGGSVFGILLAVIWRLIQRRGFIVRRFALVAVAFGIVGLAAVVVDFWPYQYRSTATLRLRGGSQQQLLALKTAVFSRTSLTAIVNDPRMRLYHDQRNTMPLEDVLETMKRHLAITQIGNLDGSIFTVSFDYPDYYKAQQTVSMTIDKLFDADQRLYPNPGPLPFFTPVVMQLLDTASLPASPTKPNRLNIALAGCIAGLIAAGLIAIVRRRWKPEADIPVDAVLP